MLRTFIAQSSTRKLAALGVGVCGAGLYIAKRGDAKCADDESAEMTKLEPDYKLGKYEYFQNHILRTPAKLFIRMMVNQIHFMWFAGAVSLSALVWKRWPMVVPAIMGCWSYFQLMDVYNTSHLVTDMVLSKDKEYCTFYYGCIYNRSKTVPIADLRLGQINPNTGWTEILQRTTSTPSKLFEIQLPTDQLPVVNIAYDSFPLVDSVLRGDVGEVKKYKRVAAPGKWHFTAIQLE